MIKRILLFMALALVLGVSQARADSRWGTMVWGQDNWFLDSDGDGIDDTADVCPADPLKSTSIGQCGCGKADTDTDGDGTADCRDNCPVNPNKIFAGQCGCSVADTDSDGDGVADCIDNCVNNANTNQADANGDSVGDVCDFVSDSDNDGVNDAQEIINGTNPLVSNNGSINLLGDYHGGVMADTAILTPGSQMTIRQSLSFNGTVAGTYAILAASEDVVPTSGTIRLLPNPDNTFSVAGTDYTGITANDESVMVLADVFDGAYMLSLKINGKKSSGIGAENLLGDYVSSQFMDAAASQAEPSISTTRTLLQFDGIGGVHYSTLANSNSANDSGPATYTVGLDGALNMAGGTGFVTPDGEMIMTVDTTLDLDPQVDDEISLSVGVRKGANMTNASLFGEFVYYEMGYELYTRTSRMVFTFNGSGSGSYTVTDDSDGQAAGAVSFSYTVSPEGNVTIDGQLLGVMSANGEYLVFADTSWNDANPGLSLGIGVKSANAAALTISKTGTGTGTVASTSPDASLSCGANCSALYTTGTVVTLTATAATGSTFIGWSGACSGKGTCQVTMAAYKTVGAEFGKILADKIGVFRPGTGTTTDTGMWYLDLSGNGKWNPAPTDRQFGPYGISTDIPIAGDWNGDGKSEIGVYRPGTSITLDSSMWYLDMNGNGKWDNSTDLRLGPFGTKTDIPIVGDWNGDGKSEIGIYRPGTSITLDSSLWYLDLNGNGKWNSTDLRLGPYGIATDKPVVGDWNGDGKSEIGIYRPGTSTTLDSSLWYLDLNGNGKWNSTDLRLGTYGIATDKPVVGDWNGDGKSEIGIYRPGTTLDSSLWYLDLNGNGKWNSTDWRLGPFGISTDIPLVGHW